MSASPENFYLKPIDLSKSFDCDHPDIKTDRTQYLVRHDGRWRIGTFGRTWYGLLFDMGSYQDQFDDASYPNKPPHYTELYEICEEPEPVTDGREPRKVRIKDGRSATETESSRARCEGEGAGREVSDDHARLRG